MNEDGKPNHSITNFGGNISFTPGYRYAPTTEAEILDILDRHARGKIRVGGALHSWSAGIVSDDVLIDLRHFDRVQVSHDPSQPSTIWATAGGGCRTKHLLHELHALVDATIPALGLITEQTIAGAISTATHGSGKHSLSHYVDELRVAAYDPATGNARIYAWDEGAELRAARCAVGCMGIILSVRFRCVPRYDVAETIVMCATLNEVLAAEEQFPLQQFYLIPHRWSYFVQRRSVTPHFEPRRGLAAKLYRTWWYCFVDVGLHLVIKSLVSVIKCPSWVRFFYRHVQSKLILKNVTVIDHGERMLVMEHELFKHLEIEIFVPASHVRQAATFVQAVVEMLDGAIAGPPEEIGAALEQIGMNDELGRLRGTYTHHYPITFRRVLPDDALIAMSVGGEPWYAISFITYVEPREPFYALASFLARSMTRLFQARLHWGKYFPLSSAEIEGAYPGLTEFRSICRRVDPHGVFRNEFAERVIFGDK